jgi:hypothetical protein
MVDEIKNTNDTIAKKEDEKQATSTVDMFKNVVKKLDGCVISLNSNIKSVWDDSLRSGINLNIYQEDRLTFKITKKLLNKDLNGFYLALINKFFVITKGDKDITSTLYKKEKPLVIVNEKIMNDRRDSKKLAYKEFVSNTLVDLRRKIDECNDGNFLHSVRKYIVEEKIYDDKAMELAILDYLTDRILQFTATNMSLLTADIEPDSDEEYNKPPKKMDNVIFKLQ